MSRTRPLPLAALALTLMAAPAGAQEGALPEGPQGAPPAADYAFVPSLSDDISDKVDEAVSHMNFLIRGIARGRLRGANEPIDLIEIRYPADSVWVRLRRDEPPIITPQSGEYTEYRRADGEVVQARTQLRAGVVEQYFDSDDGDKRTIYRLREDGLLELEVEVLSEKLREPFTYTWVYRPIRP